MATEPSIAGLDAQAHRHVVPSARGNVVWRRFGDGEPLVLLHGGHGRWTHWARNIPAWAARYSVWVPDLPGYGESDQPGAPTLDTLVAATSETLDALVGASTPIRLAGFSFGGLVAAHLAARRRGVTQLALLGPAGHGGPRRPRGALRPWKDLAAGSAARAEAMRHNLLMHMLHEPQAIDAMALTIHTDACERTRFHSKSISLAGGLGTALDAHEGDLLLALGEHDVTLTPEAVARVVTGGRSHRRVEMLPGAGHWVQYEAAGQVNRLLLAWLDEGNAQRRP